MPWKTHPEDSKADGATEMKDASGTELGIDGFIDAIALVRTAGRSDHPATAMKQMLESFNGSRQFEDDLTLLAVHYNGS